MSLDPISELRVYNPNELFGAVTYAGDHVTWDLLAAASGQAGASARGFVPDPTGDYVMQAPVHLYQDAGDAQWTPGSGDAGAYTHGTDTVTGKLGLVQKSSAASAFNTTLNISRDAEEGFYCQLYRAATTAGTLYLHLSSGRASGLPGLRLAIEAGKFIRLQVSTDDDATWTDVAIARQLGDSESYLSGVGRYLCIDVLSQCDPDWVFDDPAGSPFPPPGRVVVTINGGAAVLVYNISTLAAGSLRITGALGQWGMAAYGKKVFRLAPTASLPVQVRATAFQGDARAFVTGYTPYAGMIDVEVTTDAGTPGSTGNAAYGGIMQVLAGNQAAATLALTIPTEGQVTVSGVTYAKKTCFLSALESAWDAIQISPLDDPEYVAYAPIYATCETHFDQVSRFVRRRAVCILQSLDDRYAPGFIVPALRAARLFMGDAGDAELTPVITGWTALSALDGQEWSWVDWGKHFAITIEDRHRKGDDDQTPCLHMEPFDFQPHYYPVRYAHYRLGITDEWMTGFSNVGFDGFLPPSSGGGIGGFGGVGGIGDGPPSAFAGYFLGGGTAQEPLWQPAPDEPINSLLLRIVEKAGEIDPTSGTVQPMILGSLPDGEIVYVPMLAGIAQSYLTPGQTLADLGLGSAADYVLSDFAKGGLQTSATLSQVRTPVVLEGLDSSGNIVVGVAANESVGAGSTMDTPGAIWINVPFINISRLNSSLEVVQRAAAVAAVALSSPVVRITKAVLNFLDPARDVLQIITVTDPYTQGSFGQVPYYTDFARHTVDLTDPARHFGETSFTGRLIALSDADDPTITGGGIGGVGGVGGIGG